MATRIYGASDDLIEFDGDVRGEVSCYGTDDQKHGVLLICSDGTLLEVKYGKADMAVWGVSLLVPGYLFDRVTPCMDENADPYSDVAYFHDGLKWVYAATEWQKVS